MNQNLNITDKKVPLEYYGFIYKTTFPDGMIYVGKTKKRINVMYFGSGGEFSKQEKSVGKKNLKREIIIFVNSSKHLMLFETQFIRKLDSINPLVGYNKRSDSHDFVYTEESCRKIGDRHRNKVLSKETRDKISKTRIERKIQAHNKGIPASEEQKKNQSVKMSGENHPMYGKTHRKSTIKKMKKKRASQILPKLDRNEKGRFLKLKR